jgi:hypothetical protein
MIYESIRHQSDHHKNFSFIKLPIPLINHVFYILELT